MAKWNLHENEQILEEASASYVTKRIGILPKPNPGKLHITNQRVIFTDALTLFFEYPLAQISSFSVGMANTITLMTTDGTVSYTHLDVYKRQPLSSCTALYTIPATAASISTTLSSKIPRPFGARRIFS